MPPFLLRLTHRVFARSRPPCFSRCEQLLLSCDTGGRIRPHVVTLPENSTHLPGSHLKRKRYRLPPIHFQVRFVSFREGICLSEHHNLHTKYLRSAMQMHRFPSSERKAALDAARITAFLGKKKARLKSCFMLLHGILLLA